MAGKSKDPNVEAQRRENISKTGKANKAARNEADAKLQQQQKKGK